MRIVIVGGAGDMGRVACRATVEDPEIESVLIADRDAFRAAELATTLGSKASATALDITDAGELVNTLREADLVLNTVGPFYLFGPPVLEAAIEAGCHYADIADDWEPTLEMLRLDDAAREAGIIALIGMGASPGLSNLLAAGAHRELDFTQKLHTVWRGGSGVPKAPENPDDVRPSAAIDHWIHNLAEPIRIWRDGEAQQADALEQLEVEVPGIGAAPVWTCGHPEPITLPIAFPEISESLNLMFARPGLIDAARAVRDRVRAGELSVAEGSKEFILSSGRRGPDAGPVPDFPGVFAYAEGTRDGRRVRVTVSTNAFPEGGMGESTCIPLAIAAGMVARDEVKTRGVMGPEACIDPEVMFKRLVPYSGAREGEPLLDVRIAPIDD
ncbi:saccharopine dehydrogenase family protein [Aeromicrobium sp. CTD01-1L150]|uniref:saccharopine dehydrogenase family protein n=1 Tax=Aeromicrobium sp. CTD01-1L150 TaxID=3341830 RepID=UPI0035BF3CBF